MGLEPLAWSAKPRLDTVLSTRQLPMVVAGLLFVCSTGLAPVNGWQAEAVIALVLSTLVVAPWLVESWSDVKIPINMQIQYGMLIVTGPYLGGYGAGMTHGPLGTHLCISIQGFSLASCSWSF